MVNSIEFQRTEEYIFVIKSKIIVFIFYYFGVKVRGFTLHIMINDLMEHAPIKEQLPQEMSVIKIRNKEQLQMC